MKNGDAIRKISHEQKKKKKNLSRPVITKLISFESATQTFLECFDTYSIKMESISLKER